MARGCACRGIGNCLNNVCADRSIRNEPELQFFREVGLRMGSLQFGKSLCETPNGFFQSACRPWIICMQGRVLELHVTHQQRFVDILASKILGDVDQLFASLDWLGISLLVRRWPFDAHGHQATVSGE